MHRPSRRRDRITSTIRTLLQLLAHARPDARYGLTVFAVSILVSATIAAQARTTLTRQGDHLAINGVGQFIVFTSYFDGLNRPAATLRADLDWLKARGIGGIRVWPNTPPTPLMAHEGHLDPTVLSRLLTLVDEAATRGMVVDLTFHREAVACPSSDCTFTPEAFGDAIVAVAHTLVDRHNVLFDLQNEWDIHRQGARMRLRDFSAIRDRVRAVNPAVPIAASVTFGYGEARAAEDAFDLLAFHEGRDVYGSWAYDTDRLLGRLREALWTSGRVVPIYLQEPNRFRHPQDRQPYLDDTAEHYWVAARGAKRAGAAAWTFHTAAGFNLASTSAFEQLLLPQERRVLDELATQLADEPRWGIRPTARLRPPAGDTRKSRRGPRQLGSDW